MGELIEFKKLPKPVTLTIKAGTNKDIRCWDKFNTVFIEACKIAKVTEDQGRLFWGHIDNCIDFCYIEEIYTK